MPGICGCKVSFKLVPEGLWGFVWDATKPSGCNGNWTAEAGELSVHGTGMKLWLQVTGWIQMPHRSWLKLQNKSILLTYYNAYTHIIPYIFIFTKNQHSVNLGCKSYENHKSGSEVQATQGLLFGVRGRVGTSLWNTSLKANIVSECCLSLLTSWTLTKYYP